MSPRGFLDIFTFTLTPKAISQQTIQPCEVAMFNATKRIEKGRDINFIEKANEKFRLFF
jgi:hypothetical protein